MLLRCFRIRLAINRFFSHFRGQSLQVIFERPLHRASENTMDCWSKMLRLEADLTLTLQTSEEDLRKEKVVTLPVQHLQIIHLKDLKSDSDDFEFDVISR